MCVLLNVREYIKLIIPNSLHGLNINKEVHLYCQTKHEKEITAQENSLRKDVAIKR